MASHQSGLLLGCANSPFGYGDNAKMTRTEAKSRPCRLDPQVGIRIFYSYILGDGRYALLHSHLLSFPFLSMALRSLANLRRCSVDGSFHKVLKVAEGQRSK